MYRWVRERHMIGIRGRNFLEAPWAGGVVLLGCVIVAMLLANLPLLEEFGFYAQRLLTFQYEGESGAAKMADIMRKLRAPLDTFTDAHFPTATRIDYQNDETGLPKSDVLSFALADGSKIIVRPSGTEPKLKAYLFARGENQAAAEKVLDELETLMNGYCKE